MSSRLPSPSDYTSKLAGSLNDLRKENQLCDIIINVDGRAFHAHKNVLAARSSYFLAMFTSGFREATQGEVNIDCGKSMIFELLLEYVYTGKLEISGETAYDLLEMACFMQLTDLNQYCSKFIQLQYDLSSDTDETIPMGDVYKIYEIARCHDLKGLAKKSETHMCAYFQKLKSVDMFLSSASGQFLETFLSRKDLASKEEEKEVLELVVKWLKRDWEKRRSFTTSLLNQVRLGLIPEQNLTNLLDDEILQIPECKQLLQDVQEKQSCNESSYKLSQMFPDMFATRSTVTVPIMLAPPEGQSVEYSYFYYYYKKMWKPLNAIRPLEHLPSLIVIDDTLYAVGGVEESVREKDNDSWSYESDSYDSDRSVEYDTEFLDEFKRYDAETNRWVVLPSLNTARSKILLVYLDPRIYAISGVTNRCLYDCEYFDKVENKWNEIASLPQGFLFNSSAVAYQGSILVYGASKASHVQESINNVVTSRRYSLREEIVVYNSSTDEWQSAFRRQSEASLYKQPVLYIHNDHCYRVAYIPQNDQGLFGTLKDPSPQMAVVNELSLHSSGSDAVPVVTLGEEIKQDFIPANSLGAFRIGDEVFVATDGVVHKTDLKVREDQATDVDLGRWEAFANSNRRCNIVNFTCDIKIKP